jgi:hypothetical protein
MRTWQVVWNEGSSGLQSKWIATLWLRIKVRPSGQAGITNHMHKCIISRPLLRNWAESRERDPSFASFPRGPSRSSALSPRSPPSSPSVLASFLRFLPLFLSGADCPNLLAHLRYNLPRAGPIWHAPLTDLAGLAQLGILLLEMFILSYGPLFVCNGMSFLFPFPLDPLLPSSYLLL